MSCKVACRQQGCSCSTSEDGLGQQTSWAELPQEILQRCLSNTVQHERLQHAALACRAWNAAACSSCSSVAASFVQHPGSLWPFLSRAYYTQQWLRKHSQQVVTLQLSASNNDKPLSINIPLTSMPNLKSLHLASLEMPESNWQELGNINNRTTTAATTATTRNRASSSSSSFPSSSGITELVFSNSPDSIQELTLVKLQGLQRLQLTGWQGTAGDLSAAFASSSNTLTELALESCKVNSNNNNTAAGSLPRHHSQAAAGHAAATPTIDNFAAMLASLSKLESLTLRSCEVALMDMPAGTTHALDVPHLVRLRRLDILYGKEDQLPAALLKMVSPCALTRLDLSATNVDSFVSRSTDLLSQLPQLQQLQHLKLGHNCVSWHCQTAPMLQVVRGLSQLTSLCLDSGRLKAIHLVRHLYCMPDALPHLRLLEINRQLYGESLCYTLESLTFLRAGCMDGVKVVAEDGRSMQELVQMLAAAEPRELDEPHLLHML